MSYFSNILTATKTRYANLRQGDDADGDTEDDSHITRALRNYYLELPHRPYPEWLPPPPNQRSQSPALAPVTSLRNKYGPRQQQQQQQQQPSGASLSDIWDAPEQQQHNRPNFGRNASNPSPRPQLFPDESSTSSGGGSNGNMTAQQKIKERLWGSRGTASPPPQAQQQQQNYAPPAAIPTGPPGRIEMPMGSRRGASTGESPYLGAGMPWDDGAGGGYVAPTLVGGGMRRGGVGLQNGPRDGRAPYR
ncbi:hypothetical protein BDD12DRAFT_839619 [Trichophaea hybrida]|nr:hypothetical protein BDD12DRAFT_839619 [Trichophaea hybrida]